MVRPARDVDRLIDGMLDYGRQFRVRPAYEESLPDNLIQYPANRTADYGGGRRRVVNG